MRKHASNVGPQVGLMQPVTDQRGGGPGAPMPAPPSSPVPVSVAPPPPAPSMKTAIYRFGYSLYLKGLR